MLWEHAGKPDGADFAEPARRALEDQLRAGKTLKQICDELKYTPKEALGDDGNALPRAPSASTGSSSGGSMDAPTQVVAAPPKKKKQGPVEVGTTLGVAKRNPLDLVKVGRGPGSICAACSTGSRHQASAIAHDRIMMS